MIKNKRILGLAVVIALSVICGADLFAQKSNSSLATFGRIGNDVDDYLGTTGWSKLNLNSFFAFSRFGANIKSGWVELGAAAKISGFYVGGYFKADVTGIKYATSYDETVELIGGSGVKDTINVSGIAKSNPNATYGLLVGTGALGFKFQYEDKLAITNTGTGGVTFTEKTGPWNENYAGSVRPYVEVGGAFGPISKIGLAANLEYHRNHTVTLSATQAATVTYTDATRNNGNTADVANSTGILAATGSYVAPELYLNLGIGNFGLENNLTVPIYGTPSHGITGSETSTPGVAYVTTVYDAENEYNSRVQAAWDNRFRLIDKIQPSYAISGGSGIFTVKTKATLPVTFDVVNHSLNAKIESKQFNAELNDFYKQTNFTVTFEPKIEVGVKVKPIDALSLQGGVGFYPFNWKIDSKTTKKVDPSNNGDHQVLLDSVGGAYSVDNHVVTYNDFTLPKFNWALGFTFYYKTMATLDFVFVYNANAGVAPSIYEAVGNGLGSDATSVVLSIKL